MGANIVRLWIIGLAVFAAAGSSGVVEGQSASAAVNQVTPREFIIDPPTLENLGFEWFIEGDDNRNATVAVSYRRQGASEFRRALPLLRLGGERIYTPTRLDVVVPSMFAGSILDLEPDMVYEARVTMSDPDGVAGPASRTFTVRTRPEPTPSEGGRVLHVYPHGFDGPKTEPSYEGLMCAYNFWCSGTDWATSGRPRVRAGDTILVHAGLYKYNRYEYTNNATVNRTVPLDGTYYLTADGTKGLTVKHCRFEDVGAAVFTNYSGSSNFYIADSWFYGRNDPDHLIGWSNPGLWAQFDGVDGQVHPPVTASYVAVKLYGPGHVVAYNTTYTNYSSSDYNGFGPAAPDLGVSFRWNSPPASVRADYPGPDWSPVLETREYATLAEYSQATKQDQHSIAVDCDVFVNVPKLDARDVATLQNIYDANDFDFSLVPGSAAVDQGVVLPNVDDDFAGQAPDLGALEVGAAKPHYGPRP